MSRQDDVLASLQANNGFISAQALYTDLRTRGTRIGLATVYRVLQNLVRAGEADVVRIGDSEALYRLCRSSGHHHHLLCRSCGHAIELDDDVVGRWAGAVAEQHGFTAVDHVTEIVGTCAACRDR